MIKTEISKKDLRIFGLIWAAIFGFIAYRSENHIWFFALISSLFLVISLFFPEIFSRFKIYQNWVKFGGALGKINSFIIVFILFYAIFTPVGIILRLMKKDLLSKKIDKSKTSYFLSQRNQINDMKHQF